MDDDLYELGLSIRRDVLGEEYVARATQVDDFNRDFQQLVSETCWGWCWSGNGLTRQQRSLNNLCMLACLNRMEEFELHVRGALNNGCTLEQLRETLLQIAVYAGIPAGVSSFRVARRVLGELGVEPQLEPRA